MVMSAEPTSPVVVESDEEDEGEEEIHAILVQLFRTGVLKPQM